MKHHYALSLGLLFLSALPARAQITLNSGALSFAPGEIVTASSCGYMDPGLPGANQTWDLSALSCVAPTTSTYVTPASTGYASYFPGATVAIGGGGQFQFYKATASTFEQMGAYQSDEVVTCGNTVKVFQYPFTYNNTFSDPFSCDVVYMSTPLYNRAGTMDVTADGWGTLITSFGSVPNVLRLHAYQVYKDVSIDLEDTIFYQLDSYLFVKAGLKQPVVNIGSLTITSFGFPQNVQYASQVDASMVGVNELTAHAIGVDLIPNPATGRVEVIFGVDAGKELALDLLDLNGKVVRSWTRRTAAAGLQREVMDLDNIPAGVYLVKVTDQDGATGMKRLVKQ